jgi:UDP-GlcNAc3NAcA epimerase
MTVVGARPQFIKAAVLSRKLRTKEFSGFVKETIVHTGQHYDEMMSNVFFRQMEIPEPDFNLEVGSGNHGVVTGKMLQGIEKLIIELNPDLVMVYGDTNSTLAGALAASKLHIPVAHVEAGLRSYMMIMPEEQNRRITDHISTWLFCPTETAVKNLEKEGIKNNSTGKPDIDNKAVIKCGDIMYEAYLYYKDKALREGGVILQSIEKPFVLLTIHRAENTDNEERLAAIFELLNQYKTYPIVFPVHPRTRKIMENMNIEISKNIQLIDPVGYFDMLSLENECEFIITDSGGVQKEAYFAGKMCITLRDSTEWVELVEEGWNIVTSTDKTKILEALQLCSSGKKGNNVKLYGDGNTSDIILSTLCSNY